MKTFISKHTNKIINLAITATIVTIGYFVITGNVIPMLIVAGSLFVFMIVLETI